MRGQFVYSSTPGAIGPFGGLPLMWPRLEHPPRRSIRAQEMSARLRRRPPLKIARLGQPISHGPAPSRNLRSTARPRAAPWKNRCPARRSSSPRPRPSRRRSSHLGLLEKHKDYKLRAVDFHRKEDALQKMKEKAALKNPDEFYFNMVRTKKVPPSRPPRPPAAAARMPLRRRVRRWTACTRSRRSRSRRRARWTGSRRRTSATSP